MAVSARPVNGRRTSRLAGRRDGQSDSEGRPQRKGTNLEMLGLPDFAGGPLPEVRGVAPGRAAN